MTQQPRIGLGAPVTGLSDYIKMFPKAVITDAHGNDLKRASVGGMTVGAPTIGTGIDGQLLEVPKIVPAIANEALPNEVAPPAVPYTTALRVNDTITFPFHLRSNPYGPMLVKGFYALAFDDSGNLLQLDKDQGGDTIEASFRITGEDIWTGHLELSQDDWYVLPLPVEAGAGAQVQLTLTRRAVATALPETVYLAWGLFGVQRHFIPPSFHIDSSLDPIRNVTAGFTVTTFLARTLADPLTPSVTDVPVQFVNRHPTIVDEMWFGGEEATFFTLNWEAGEISPRPIPTALFRYSRQGGQLPSPLLINAPMTLRYAIHNWLPTNITQALNVSGASFGY